MPDYNAPLRDIHFVMNEVLAYPEHYQSLNAFNEVTPDIVDAILEEASKFATNELAPLNRVGDEAGCQWNEGDVTTPAGFQAAYKSFVDNGWAGLSQPLEYDGQSMPPSLSAVVSEFLYTANHAWAMYPTLTWGAIKTVLAHGEQTLKDRFVKPLVSGQWSGTMCLTEAHCGSDLGLLRTKAVQDADGSYRISGSKMFISAGEHDLAENIVHIVLARIEGAPSGTKGISLFLIPKCNVDNEGNITGRNSVSCGSIEHKMGIHGNATCVINFDQAKGFLIGEENRGLNHMFTFINESRLGVAQQGHAAIELSFQGALSYAKERLQMRAPVRKSPDKAADPIIVHPDVRRMLLTQKALAEGGRVLNYYCAQQVDIAHVSPDAAQRERAEALLALLTPIAKGFLTEMGMEAANYGIQVLGGHGYISEWGMEQIARDVRITAIYEGTNGIQGVDLLGRKVLASGGKILQPFVSEIRDFIHANSDKPAMQVFLPTLAAKVDEWIVLTNDIGAAASDNLDEINAAAFDYLMYAGYVATAYFLAKSALFASEQDGEFYRAKMDTVRFYYQRVLPRTDTLASTMRSGAANLMQLDEAHFAF